MRPRRDGSKGWMEQKTAYLDNAATTRACPAAVEAAARMMRDCFGNPSSLHGMGLASAREMASAREAVAALLGCQTECVTFTSGGSEANNLAIFGGAAARARRGGKLVTTAAEHSSVSAAMKRLGEQGWEVTYVKPGPNGKIDAEAFAAAVDEQTALVSMMLVNNETGAIFPVAEAAKLIRRKNPETLIHCDGVQALGKLPLRVSRMEIDLMSVSGHKVCGPKGSGALYVRRGVRILPQICGGGQEKGLRSGTENLPAIAGFGAACAQLAGKMQQNFTRAQALRDRLAGQLAAVDGVRLNSPADGSPYIVNFSVPGYRSETMLHFLESRGVYVSSGSACSKGATSPVLTSMGLPAPVVDGALRVSFIYDTAEEELDMLISALREGMAKVAHK